MWGGRFGEKQRKKSGQGERKDKKMKRPLVFAGCASKRKAKYKKGGIIYGRL